MKRMQKMSLWGILVAVIMAMMLSMSPAQADTSTSVPSCANADTSTGSGSCADIKSSSSSAQETDSSYAAVGTQGKVLVRYNMAAGIKLKKKEKSNKGCPLVHNAKQIPAGATCIRGARGFKYINSGITQAGVLVKWQDSVGNPKSSTPNAKWIKFVKRGAQWFKADANTGGGNCGNEVWFFGRKPKLTVSQVILVKSWADWSFTGHVAVKAAASAVAKSQSWCNANGSSAWASASGSSNSTSGGSASYTVKGLSKIKTWIKGTSASLQQHYKLKVDADAKAKALDNAVANSSTKAVCSSSGGTTPPPPPVDHKPQISCTFPPHIYVNGNQQFWCNASDSDGDALSVNITGDSFAHVSSVIQVAPGDSNYNKDICDSSQTCFRATLWGDQVGTATITAKVTANGVSGDPAVGYVKVLDPNDGF